MRAAGGLRVRCRPMARDRMPVWQSSMSWVSDAVADGSWWKKLIVYVGLLLAVALVIALALVLFGDGGPSRLLHR